MGAGPRVASRQVAALLALAGVLAVVGIGNDSRRAGDLLIIAAADLGLAGLIVLLPWHRWPPMTPVLLALPAFVVLGFSTWAFGGVATGTGPFLVLIFAWAALHYSRWVLLALTVPALAAYLIPLILTHQPAAILGSSVVLLPVAMGVALLIEAQARHLRDDRARIGEIERWRAGLVATLAHDVRSPLSTVQMALEHLRDHPGPRSAEFIAGALRQVARITALTAGLLDLDRIDTEGRLRLDLRSWPAREVVVEAVAYVRGDVTLEIDPALMVTVDRERLEQIVVNLVGNGLRHGTPPVVVSLTAAGGLARLEVRDHGPGVPEEQRPRLFTRFGGGSTGSVGLGLWIVGQLAQAHGGEAHYEDVPGGALMVVTWPTDVL